MTDENKTLLRVLDAEGGLISELEFEDEEFREIEAAAEGAGMSLEDFLVEALRAYTKDSWHH